MSIVIACVLKHFRRKAKTCQFTCGFIILKIFCSCCNTDSCRCADNLQIRVVLKKRRCLVCRFLRLIITISNFYKLQFAVFLIFFHNFLHSVDPCVLVCSLGCGRKNCKLAFSAGNIKDCIHKSLSYSHSTCLIYKYLTAVFIGCRVKRGYLDPCIHSFCQFCLKSIYIVCCNADCIKILGNQVVKNFDLSISSCCLRIYNLHCSAFCFHCFLKGSCCDLKERVAC